MKRGMLVLVLALCVAAPAAAKPIRLYHPDTAPKYKLLIVKRVVRHAEHVQAFFETHPQLARSRPGRAALWRQVRLLRAALGAVRQLRRELWRTLPDTNDWVMATTIAQRPYPGTQNWMLDISDREGGRGEWVWFGGRPWMGFHIGDDYLGADTVGGWMQFRYSTFAPYWRGAVKDLRRRGFHIPNLGRGYRPWLSPLGQALTAGYMRYYGRDGCHWCL